MGEEFRTVGFSCCSLPCCVSLYACVKGLRAALNAPCQGFKTCSESTHSVPQPVGLWHGLLGLSLTSYSLLQGDHKTCAGLFMLLCGLFPIFIVFVITTWKTLKSLGLFTYSYFQVAPVYPVAINKQRFYRPSTFLSQFVINVASSVGRHPHC